MAQDNANQDAQNDPVIIKKYANRRLYNTGTSTYVTLDDLAVMVKNGEDFKVVDAKSGDEITRSVLTQIIFEQESKGQNLLPISVLRQLIQFYDDSMQALLPSYLEHSMNAFVNDKDSMTKMMTQAMGGNAMSMMQDQVQRNMEMYRRAVSMFSPFGAGAGGVGEASSPASAETNRDQDLDTLKEQMQAMQSRLDALSGKG